MMKKRVFSLFLALAMLCTLLPQVSLFASAEVYSGSCGNNLTWSFDTETGLLTIEGSGEMVDMYQDYPWRKYGEAITALSLPEGLTSIGIGAFSDCTELTEVSLPASMTKIASSAFYGCSGLKSIRFPANVTEIASGAFRGCVALEQYIVDPANQEYSGLDGVLFNQNQTVLFLFPIGKGNASYEVPDGVASIASGAFCDCADLTAITFPASLCSIGDGAFENCVGLTAITLPEAVTRISNDAFRGCTGLTEIGFPSTLTDIGSNAFFGCIGLTGICFPSSITSIGNNAFSHCNGLTVITIPESLENINYSAFSDCTALREFSVDPANPAYSSLNGVLFSKNQLSLIQYPIGNPATAYEVPEGVISIAWCAFYDSPYLTDIFFPASLESGVGVNNGCISLSAFHVDPDNQKYSSLDGVLFNKAKTELIRYPIHKSASSYQVPPEVTNIRDNAFGGCIGLTNVTLPEGLKIIELGAFGGCSGLTSVDIPGTVERIATGAFSGCSSLISVTLHDGVTTIDGYAFAYCSALTNVNFPESLTQVSYKAFLDCGALTSVTLPESLTVIGYAAFGYYDNGEIEYGKYADFTIYGYYGSAAESYAIQSGFTFIPLRSNPFVDVHDTDFFFHPVMWAVENSITGGIDDTHFAPGNTVMRSDAMMFFWAANKRPDPEGKKSPFKDVGKKHWAFKPIMWGVENGVTGGTGPKTFSPDKTCSRSEILQFLYAAMGKPEYTISNPYSDLKPKQWYYDGAIWAYENGLEKGENGKFKAKTPCTRGYVVTYLYRFFTHNELAE